MWNDSPPLEVRRQQFEKGTILYEVQLLLSTNNYILLFLLGILTLTVNIRMFQGDLKEFNDEKETFTCRIHTFIFYGFISSVYQAFILQAIFRLCRIVYTSRQNLSSYHTYWLIIPFIWLFSFLINLPLLLWHGHRLIPTENVCLVPKDDSLSIIYSILTVYGIPFVCITLIYFHLTRFLNKSTGNENLSQMKRSRDRDVLVIRRIILIIILLGIFGLPTVIMLILLAFTNELVFCFYRILVLSVSICVLTLSLALIYITPQIYNQIHFHRRKTKVIPISNILRQKSIR
ncbi:hypothetical protein I4U23_016724 [Adineta vaga]|nr:hypothetical protein I4U23_016724 [Adineta vaga]